VKAAREGAKGSIILGHYEAAYLHSGIGVKKDAHFLESQNF
jgi:hypothetical protein